MHLRTPLVVAIAATAVTVAVSALVLNRSPEPISTGLPPARPMVAGAAAATTAPSSPAGVASTPAAATGGPSICTINAILVNSCRPWLGARADGYPEADDNTRAQLEYHERRIGRKVDIAHSYSPVGSVPLSNRHDRYLATRAGTHLLVNWKPAAIWADADGSDPAVETRIRQAIANIKAVAPKKIFLTLHHEPENDVATAGSCATRPGTAGTPADYRGMWHHVRARFDAAGVRNVVWVMDYMNHPRWDCLVPMLYPGDRYVDWIMFNAYGTGRAPDFVQNVTRFQQLLAGLHGPRRQLLIKPWGIVEWGVHDATPRQARRYYLQAAKALSDNTFPNLRAFLIFDSPGTHGQGGLRVRYDDTGGVDAAEQDAYRAFANHPELSP